MSSEPVSVAVMPFRNLSPEPDTEYFANGFVEDLTADLARFTSLRVLGSETMFLLGRTDRPVDDLATEWGLQFVLRGSIRRDDTSLRVSVQLIHLEGREVVWGERIDAPLEGLFAVRDKIVATVAGRLAVQIDETSLRVARHKAPGSLQAYDCWLRGMDCLRRGTLEGDEESRLFFKQAISIDPQLGRAYSGLSLSYFNEWTCQAWHLWEESESSAFSHASKAIELDPTDSVAHGVLARLFRYRRQHEQADRYAALAMALNPNDAHVLIQVAVSKLFGGEFEEGLALACKASKLNPLHGRFYPAVIGWSLFMMHRYDQALHYLTQAGEATVELAAYRAACAVVAGDLDRARSEYTTFVREYRNKIAFGREPEPREPLTWVVQVEPFRSMADSRHMPDILSSADIAEIDVSAALAQLGQLRIRPAEIALEANGNMFSRRGEIWTVSYKGTGARLVGLKGFDDIARLLRQPGVPLHCLELSGAPSASDKPEDVLDVKARQDYRRRIEELQREIEKAEADNDPARLDPARRELDALIDELSRATGLGGRAKKMSNSAERARSTVTWRIRSAIKKINAAHPRLGQHLYNSIRTGHFCVYSPESTTGWEL